MQHPRVVTIGEPRTRVTSETENLQPRSRYLEAGAPRYCFLPTCRKGSARRAFTARMDTKYGSQVCAGSARRMGLSRVLEMKQRRASMPYTRGQMPRDGAAFALWGVKLQLAGPQQNSGLRRTCAGS